MSTIVSSLSIYMSLIIWLGSKLCVWVFFWRRPFITIANKTYGYWIFKRTVTLVNVKYKDRKIFLMVYDNIDITKDTCDVSFNCSSKFLILMKILRNFRQLLTMTTTPMTFISNFIPNSEKLFNKRFKLLTISHHSIYFSFYVQLMADSGYCVVSFMLKDGQIKLYFVFYCLWFQ